MQLHQTHKGNSLASLGDAKPNGQCWFPRAPPSEHGGKGNKNIRHQARRFPSPFFPPLILMSVSYWHHYRNSPDSVQWGTILRPVSFQPLTSFGHFDIHRNTHGQLFDMFFYRGHLIDASEFYPIQETDSIFLPPDTFCIIAHVKSNFDTVWTTVGTTTGRIVSISPQNYPCKHFFIVLGWAGDNDRVYLRNRNYMDIHLNQHYPHRTKRQVRHNRRALSLPISTHFRNFPNVMNFCYY